MARRERAIRAWFSAPFLVLFLATACSKGTSTPIPALSPLPGSTMLATMGVAYIPDGGNAATTGLQVVHFEDLNGALVPSPAAASLSGIVTFPGSVGPLAFASDGSTAVSADATAVGPPFTQIQEIFGLSGAALLPVGLTYNVTQLPAPAASPTPAPTTTPTISDVTGLAIVGTGANSIALTLGANSNGILGVSSLENAPPRYAQLIPFSSASFTSTASPPPGARTSVIVASDSSEALVRGPDLIAYQVTSVGTGYQLNATAYSAALGMHPNALLGRGAMAFDPVADGSALLLQAPHANDVTLVSGLPSAINTVATVTLPTHPHTVAWSPNGQYALVGADGGYYTFSGGDGALTLASQAPQNPSFTGCDGQPHTLSSVTSIAVSVDSRYVVLFGPSSATCASGANGALVAVPFAQSVASFPTPSPSSTPIPAIFVQNMLTTPSNTDQDYMLVR